MENSQHAFDEGKVLHKLSHYLPSQAPLKDFVHHNSLHAFQDKKFHSALKHASTIFGYKVYSEFDEYRAYFEKGKIRKNILESSISKFLPGENKENVMLDLFTIKDRDITSRIGKFRSNWKDKAKINVDKEVHGLLFRLVGSYLDQGIASWSMPRNEKGLLSSIRNIEKESGVSLFKTNRVSKLLLDKSTDISTLLQLIVGDSKYYETYLFDMLFAHPGWSGMIVQVENLKESLLDYRAVNLRDFVILELLLELDAIEAKMGSDFSPLAEYVEKDNYNLFAEIEFDYTDYLKMIWQHALEWSYFDQVLAGMKCAPEIENKLYRFQAMFCIDDREMSLRTYLEKEAEIETFGTAGFFNIPIYFQPEHSKFHTKSCPAPMTPSHIIKEKNSRKRHQKDTHFGRRHQGILSGWLISQTLGFWSAMKMTKNIFFPSESSVMVSSFKHMDRDANLTVDFKKEDASHLKIGFTQEEMVNLMTGLLKSIGLIDSFSNLVYIVGHGASSINNTYYAGYDCGACSGRAGSVNARVAADILNRADIRARLLDQAGITIPESTQFIGGLHDTTRDEIEFYDEDQLNESNGIQHKENVAIFKVALEKNARERSRRFDLINSNDRSDRVHDAMKKRSMSLFEPRPEWNHATNSLCIVGRRDTNKHLFLDRRAFLQSYDYALDPKGEYLLGILRAVAPVCGGINLEYYFSRVDNQRLGAGSKLPHNVMGLIGVVNGMEGDLRTGLPEQMISIHDPLRLMVVVEHFPTVILDVLSKDAGMREWFENDWVVLSAIEPETKTVLVYDSGYFIPYGEETTQPEECTNLEELILKTSDNIDVHLINEE